MKYQITRETYDIFLFFKARGFWMKSMTEYIFLSCGKILPGIEKPEEEHLFSRSEGRRTVVLSERSEVKTVLLTGERVNSSSEVFSLARTKFFM